jgi:hypothetical protein
MTNTSSKTRAFLRSDCLNGVRQLAVQLFVALAFAQSAVAQAPARDPSARLKEVLPADVAARVLARIADARARRLPAEALENRALKFAAKGVDPRNIERSITEQAQRMEGARSALVTGRGANPAGDEIEAGAEAMRKGVDGASVAELARSSPRGRSLAVPLFVIGSLVDRGLPVDQALQRVLTQLQSRASDADLEAMSSGVSANANPGQGRPDGMTGREFGQSHRRAGTGKPATAGPPAGVPGNAGKKTGQSHRPPKK